MHSNLSAAINSSLQSRVLNFQIEIPNTMFTSYLYESQGIEIALSNSEIDTDSDSKNLE